MKKAIIYTIINPKQPDSHLSGGFAATDSLIEAIEANGFTVDIITPVDEWVDPTTADLCIYIDIFNDPEGSNGWFEKEHYGSFLKAKKYIILECAYTGCTPTPYGLGGRVDGGSYEQTQLSEYMAHLTKGSSLNIFLSPLHRYEFQKFLGCTIDRVYDFFQPIDVEVFNNQNRERDIPFLYVGALNWFKGLDNVLEIFGDKGLHVVGRRTDVVSALPNSVIYLGEKTPKELAEVYNRSKRFIHLPRWQEPSARTVVEAALCGCDLIVNENVGVLSFGYDIRDPNLSALSKSHINKVLGEVLNA